MDTNGNLRTLLLKDLCSRLPYKVECEAILNNGGNYPCVLDIGTLNWHINGDHVLKPYLRQMSSMTEEELKEFKSILNYNGTYDCFLIALKVGKIIDTNFALLVDWLNKNMFDYRGLIPKGIALEAPKGMYKI